MSYNAIVMVLVGISVVGAIAIPFGDPQFLDRVIALELSFITLAVVILFGGKLTVRGVTTCKICALCLHTNCYHCNSGKFACIASHRDYDNILKTTQCYIANNWWLCLAGSTYWYSHFPLCKAAQSRCSKRKDVDGCQKDFWQKVYLYLCPVSIVSKT